MPTLVIANQQSKAIHCEDKRESLLDILLGSTDWMHACGAKGRCTTCKAKIISGMENLSPRSGTEEQYLKLNKLREDERLTCQTYLRGDATIERPKKPNYPI